MKPIAQPLARTQGIVVRNIEDETLVYDFDTKETLCLDQTLATVWARCDGTTSVEELSQLIAPAEPRATSRDLAWIAIEQLRAKGLLVPESLGAGVQNKFHGLSRREMIKRAAVVGLAVPTIIIVTATPAAAQASLACSCASPAGTNARPPGCPCGGNNSDCCGLCPTQGPNANMCVPAQTPKPMAPCCT